jgi:hypothetical protein
MKSFHPFVIFDMPYLPYMGSDFGDSCAIGFILASFTQHVMFVSSVVFTIALVVKEAIILGDLNQIGKRSFFNPFLVVQREGHKEA